MSEFRSRTDTTTRRRQQFVVAGGLDPNKADSLSTPMEFALLKNCYPDRRLGGIVKRDGSQTEVVDTKESYGRVLGFGQRQSQSSSELMPVCTETLVNFAGVKFFKRSPGAEYTDLSVDENCSFNNIRTNTFSQLGSYLFIAGGKPAKWAGGESDVEPIGIPSPATPITFSLSSGTLSADAEEGYQYMWAYLNSETGVTSDWSPLSERTEDFELKKVVLTLPTTEALAPGVDKKIIYRTLNGGTTFFQHSIQDIETATIDDETEDNDLGVESPDADTRLLPPAVSYLTVAFNNRIWMIDAANPYNVRFSQPYIGNDDVLNYYPVRNRRTFDHPVTGMLVIPGQLLFFHPDGISTVSGFSEQDFVFQPYIEKAGTLFPDSIATNGDKIVWLDQPGFMTIENGKPRVISRPIDPLLRPILSGSYSSDLYISCRWNPVLRQFIFTVSAVSLDGALWEYADTGVTADWIDVDTGETEAWDFIGEEVEPEGRVKIFGWSPDFSGKEGDIWIEYTIPQTPDESGNGKIITTLLHPLPCSGTLNPTQDHFLVGFYDGTEGGVLRLFDQKKVRDDDDPVISEAILGRCQPGSDSGNVKSIKAISFDGDYADPSTTGILKYLADYADPALREYTSQLQDFSDRGDMKYFKTRRLKFFHVYLRDESTVKNKIMIQKFWVYFREREGRETR